MNFCHLHLHSHYSLLDGANRIDDVVRRAAELKMPALALTDHGNLFGAVQFHDRAVRHGVKPIIGCEVYVARNGRKSREGRSSQSNHLILLAQNEKGYKNLLRMVSLGYLEGFYYRPRIDKELLSEYSEGLICLSACLQGKVASHLTREEYDQARREAGEMAEIFGRGNYYLELQNHEIEEQKTVNEGLLKLARDLDLPMVATNDCHYLYQKDAQAHDVLMCIQTGKTVGDTNRLMYKTKEFYFKTAEEMEKLFGHVPNALSNTVEIADRCEFGFGATQNIFPDFEVPAGETVESYFEKVVREGLNERFGQLKKLEHQGLLSHSIEEYEGRLDREIGIIKQMNFPAYFLIVWDFIRYAREAGIPVGPGRGSAAGSLVSYAMKITDIDPLQYDLLFERFLNPERVTPPDIDIDFCMLRRGEVIDYVTQRYGQDSVSHIITFGTMAARGAIRDVGRSLDISYAEVDKIAKLVPQTPNATIEKSLETVKELQETARSDPRYAELIDVAQRLEGLSRHASTHAAGVVIAPQPLIELIPLYKSNKDEITTQYPMTDLERLGLLKMDFLGLTTLTVIQQSLAQIKDQLGVDLELDEIPLDDPKTLELFCDGRTSGIFQFESAGMRDILRRLQPTKLEDLIALNALYRPGPIKGGMIDDFIERRHGRVKVEYELPQLEEILEETYGVIVYQEQVMQIASALGGFSLGGADLLRRAMGKKKKSVMEAQRKAFLTGSSERDIDPDKAKRIFDLMDKFAGYGFNKSHSTAYAYLAYQTGYLKAHYPVQFMAALLTSETASTDKIVQYLSEARDMGISILPPDINSSSLDFQGVPESSIRFGLAAIKNAGESAIREVIRRRNELGQFKDFFEFFEQVDLRMVNKRVVEALIKAGAFDQLHPRRKSLFEILDRAIEHGQKVQRDRLSGQKGLFGALAGEETETGGGEIPDLGEWRDREKWAFEKETLGFYLSGHPLQKYQAELKSFSRYSTGDISDSLGGQEVTIGGVIAGVRKLQTRKGDPMAIFQLEDTEGVVEVLLWPNSYEAYRHFLESEKPILVRGKCDVDARGEVKILCAEIRDLSNVWEEGVQKAKIRIPVPGLAEDQITKFQSIIHRYPGRCSLEFELFEKQNYCLHVVPSQKIQINPVPEFVQEVEGLFGGKSCILEIPR
ncbi:MAG: DNA polymerase III subunit alpha [Acidobacteriota bacterium]|nr:MAG: DNA polymerase III subunit alpha [Acidobacteriota bacterium]